MRTLRHPGVIKVFDTVEGTLSFINDEATSVHGNVRLTSIYTSQSGEWRLGGFELLSSMKDDNAIIYTMGSLEPDSALYAPPEVAKSGWDTIKRHPLAAADSYGFALLMYEVFNGRQITNDSIGHTNNIPPSMHQSYRRLLNHNAKSRLSVSHLRGQGRRSGGFFETPLITLSEGIESLGLKSEDDRNHFLSELDEAANDFPEEYFSAKVLPELLKSVEFGGGGPKVFASVMKISTKLSDEDYSTKLTPVIIRLFTNPDRAIRVCLLDHLPQMIEHLPQKMVNDKIFPQMVTGFADVAPLVREQTVKAVLTVITKLSDRTINGELLKHLAKTSNDEQPGIRTNTTICLGKIARSLGAHTRQKVLVAAFGRSLRDPFLHARNAALLALAATSDLFNEDDCAAKILPALCSLLVDKEKSAHLLFNRHSRLVRDQANKTFDIYVQRVRKHASTMPDSVLPPATTSANGTSPRIGTPQNDTGWAGWAISSFTNKLATASGEMQPKPSSANSIPTRPSSVPLTADNSRLALAAMPVTNLHRQAVKGYTAPVLTGTSTDQFFGDAQEEDDDIDEAWGNLGEDSISNASMLQQPATESGTPIPSTNFDDRGEPDFEGWLKAQAQAKSKAPLPKGLSKPTKLTNGRQAAARSSTTGSVDSGTGTKQLANTTLAATNASDARAIDTRPKEPSGDDDWGDAWD
ncbi:MAG: hypothetical protein Q9228_000842 [Teloschistes exilis]